MKIYGARYQDIRTCPYGCCGPFLVTDRGRVARNAATRAARKRARQLERREIEKEEVAA